MFAPIADNTHRYHVYAVLCQEDDSEGPGFIKFGYSSDIGKRLAAVRQGCPIPAKYFAIVETNQNKRAALKVEGTLVDIFRHRRTRGEWFKFDFSDAEDREAFNEGSRRAFYICGRQMRDSWWTKISAAQYDQHQKNRQISWLKRNGHDSQAQALAKRHQTEYAAYRG